jgi:hypothetical protein
LKKQHQKWPEHRRTSGKITIRNLVPGARLIGIPPEFATHFNEHKEHFYVLNFAKASGKPKMTEHFLSDRSPAELRPLASPSGHSITLTQCVHNTQYNTHTPFGK